MIKNMVLGAIIFAVAACMAQTATAVMTAELQDFLKSNPETKICIELKNSSNEPLVNIDSLKRCLEAAFEARKSHKFVIVQSAGDADMVLKGDIVEYVWAEVDPVDQVWGVGAAAMDAAMMENYARIQIRIQLVAAKSNRTLWEDKVKATMTKSDMPKDASYNPVCDNFVKSLFIELFKKRS